MLKMELKPGQPKRARGEFFDTFLYGVGSTLADTGSDVSHALNVRIGSYILKRLEKAGHQIRAKTPRDAILSTLQLCCDLGLIERVVVEEREKDLFAFHIFGFCGFDSCLEEGKDLIGSHPLCAIMAATLNNLYHRYEISGFKYNSKEKKWLIQAKIRKVKDRYSI